MQQTWLKNLNGGWQSISNDQLPQSFTDSLRSTEELGIVRNDKSKRSVIYIPTHNILDVYEWFRIFGNVQLKSGPLNQQQTGTIDPFGHWMHAYFDKERCQSIRDFFPNLVEVKAGSSATDLVYDGGIRYSKDWINLTLAYQELIIDGVPIFEGEKILVKILRFETLVLDPTNPALASSTNIALISSPQAQTRYQLGSSIRLQGAEWYTRKITETSSIVVGLTTYLILTFEEPILDLITDVGSIENGVWIETSFADQNGVYIYSNSSLSLIPEMSDKYKTWNQIVYLYQGISGQNQEWYLRRIEDITSPGWTQYPYQGLASGTKFNYSRGNSHLIAAEIDYNLNLSEPAHPTVLPYSRDGDEANYKILFLDYDIARKIMQTSSIGLGTWQPVSIQLGSGQYANGAGNGGVRFPDITFTTVDSLGNSNILQQWADSDYPDSLLQTGVVPNFTFRSTPVLGTGGEVFTYKVDTTVDSITYSQLLTTSQIYLQYGGIISNWLVDIVAINPGDFIVLEWQVNGIGQYLKHTFLIINCTATNTDFLLEIYPKLDQQLYNELTSYNQTPGKHTLTIDLVNCYGQWTPFNTNYDVFTEIDYLERAIKKTRLADIYQLEFNVSNLPRVKVRIKTVSNIPNLDTIPALNPNYGINVTLLQVGDLILVAEQNNPIENGVYEWWGVGNKMVKITNILADTIFHVQDAIFQWNIYQIKYTQNPSGPNLPQFVNFDQLSSFDGSMTISGIMQSHPWKWSNHSTTVVDENFVVYQFNNIYQQVGDVYSTEYTANRYLNNYLGLVGQPSRPNIDYNIPSNTFIYNNIPPLTLNPTRLGFEGNVILFGSNYKEWFLDHIGRQSWLSIVPTLASPTLVTFVHETEWNEELGLGSCTLNVQFDGTQIPANGESVNFNPIKNAIQISNLLNATDNNFPIGTNVRPDSGHYAYRLMNSALVTGTSTPHDLLLRTLTGIAFKELGEPRLSLRKRDRKWQYNNFPLIRLTVATTGPIIILSPPSVIDSWILLDGDIILVKDQTVLEENGVWIYNQSTNSLSRFSPFDDLTVYQPTEGVINVNKQWQADFWNPILSNKTLVYGQTEIQFFSTLYQMSKDERLTLKPFKIAKLGVDNKTQPWQKINMKYDSIEPERNLLSIGIGINGRRRIRFINGLTENNIINDISGQGQYQWILDEDVLVLDAVVGCTQINGPGTGDLVWYTGTWQSGTWVNGIWQSGVWESGIWLGGTWNSVQIADYWYDVDILEELGVQDQMSIWKGGLWKGGLWTGGTWQSGVWESGVWTNGLWQSGQWLSGDHWCGRWIDGLWQNGTWYGGDFERGEWINGVFGETVPGNSLYVACSPRFGVTATSGTSTRAVWRDGVFKTGEWMSGLTLFGNQQVASANHNGAIWFAGVWQNGIWWGGTFVSGIWQNGLWYDGVWIGGWYANFSDITPSNPTKQLNINGNQWLSIVGVSNFEHRSHTTGQLQKYLLAYPTGFPTTPAPISIRSLYINLHEYYNTSIYTTIPVDTSQSNNNTNLYLQTGITSPIGGITYESENSITGQVKGDPFLAAVWQNGTWKDGYWMNGVWLNGIFESGIWANGYWQNGQTGLL